MNSCRRTIVLAALAASLLGCDGHRGHTGMTGTEAPAAAPAERHADRLRPSQPHDTNPPPAVDSDPPPLQPVAEVDLARYMGKWYEIARYPNSFQRGLVGVIARYRLKDNGDIEVINTGRRKTLDGLETRSTARGWVQGPDSNAKLWVQFVWPLRAHYWIIDLCPDYSFAVVGQPGREHLWILGRTPTMDDDTYAEICQRLKRQGYDPGRLERTPQPPADN